MPRKSEFDVTISKAGSKAGYKTWTGHVTHHVGVIKERYLGS